MLRFIFQQILFYLPRILAVFLLMFVLSVWMNNQSSQVIFPWLQSDAFYLNFIHYFKSIFSGDLGISLASQKPVLDEIISVLPASLEIIIISTFISIFFGCSLGVIVAYHKNKMIDHFLTSGSLLGISTPIFWWALLTILIVSANLNWAPAAGRIHLLFDIEPVTGFMLIDCWLSGKPYANEAFYNALSHLVLPSLVVSIIPTSLFYLLTRNTLVNILQQDFMLTAKAMGISRFSEIFRYALRNALAPLMSMIISQISIIITCIILTEIAFSWPGLGKWLLEALHRQDLPSIHAGILFISLTIMLINFILDIIRGLSDPRVRQ